MRIALDVSAVPARPAGAGVYVMRAAEALARRDDVTLDLVATRGDAPRWEWTAPGASVHDVVPGPRPLRLAWEQLGAPGIAGRLGADAWHGPHYTIPVRSSVPTVVTVHDMTFFDHPEWHERAKVEYFRRMIALSAGRADALICVSAYTAARLDAVVSPRAPVSVVPHGVDHQRFSPASSSVSASDDATRLADLGVRHPFVAFVGTREPRKGLAVLGAAFGRLAPAHPDLQLVLAGQPGWGHADPVSTGDRVVDLGYVDDAVVPALFRTAAAVAYPSFEEGFGLPALEALACGAALVTTSGSAMEEVVGDAGLLVPPGDVDALATALHMLVAGGPEVDRLRTAGPARAARYTWNRCAEGHVAAYRSVT